MAAGSQNGVSNNPNGRFKGSKNKRTQEWEKLGEFITEKGAAKAMRILNNMDDETYLDQFGKLLNYFKPKMSYVVQENSNKEILPVHFIIDNPMEEDDEPTV